MNSTNTAKRNKEISRVNNHKRTPSKHGLIRKKNSESVCPWSGLVPRKQAVACATACEKKEFKKCAQVARKILENEPNSGQAYIYLCVALFELRKYKKAYDEATRGLSTNYGDFRFRACMISVRKACRLLQGLRKEAESDLRKGWYESHLTALRDAELLVPVTSWTDVGPNRVCLLTDPEGEFWSEHDYLWENIHKLYMKGEYTEADFDLRKARFQSRFSFYLKRLKMYNNGQFNLRLPHNIWERPYHFRSKDFCMLFEGCDGKRYWQEPPKIREDLFEQACNGSVYFKDVVADFSCYCYPKKGENLYERESPGALHTNSCTPIPFYQFPVWEPESFQTVVTPHPDMDVFYSNDAVPAGLQRRLAILLDRLEKSHGTKPMPKYHNIIDPNVNLWTPTDFQVSNVKVAPIDLVIAVELASVHVIGRRLPFGITRRILQFVDPVGNVIGRCTMRSPIPDLEAHKYSKLHVAVEKVMEAALPMLAKLRRPALLLPGPLQTVVKAQRIVLKPGEHYTGVWHEDGIDQHVVAVVLYYYRCSPNLKGGNLEFCSKETLPHSGEDDEGTTKEEEKLNRLRALPRCQIPVSQGTLVCFSNYAAVHRVLRQELVRNEAGGSRDFLAFFVIDQRHPLPAFPVGLHKSRGERIIGAMELLRQQLKPRGKIGSEEIYLGGNWAAGDIGWIRDMQSNFDDTRLGLDLLMMSPPVLDRGISLMLPPNEESRLSDIYEEDRLDNIEYHPYQPTIESEWYDEPRFVEVWYGSSDPTLCSVCYVDLWYSRMIRYLNGSVGEIKHFASIQEFREYSKENNYYTDDEVLKALVNQDFIHLVVAGKPYFFTKRQLQGIVKMEGLDEGACYDLDEVLLNPFPKHGASKNNEEHQAYEEMVQFATENELEVSAMPLVVDFIHNPEKEIYSSISEKEFGSDFHSMKTIASHLRFPVLWAKFEGALQQAEEIDSLE